MAEPALERAAGQEAAGRPRSGRLSVLPGPDERMRGTACRDPAVPPPVGGVALLVAGQCSRPAAPSRAPPNSTPRRSGASEAACAGGAPAG